MDELRRKQEQLQQNIKAIGRLAVAFSGGVDSAFLLRTAADALGAERVLALTAVSPFFPKREREEARAFCEECKIAQMEVPVEVLKAEGVAENPKNRCYLCKRAILGALVEAAGARGFHVVAEGSNMDDEGDYRPGQQAVRELGILSPLKEAGLFKAEIRELSKRLGLEAWDKPSFACLASRFVYGEALTEEKLGMVEAAEAYLMEHGFRQLRVRVHGEPPGMLARIEVLPEELARLMEPGLREAVCERFQKLGFSYVAVDLEGFRSGSMNLF